ncbi:hypothetical protein [Pseudazoarcus pumilus]|nr:hypothetical protein [Pseudazoarcus pumilus]
MNPTLKKGRIVPRKRAYCPPASGCAEASPDILTKVNDPPDFYVESDITI